MDTFCIDLNIILQCSCCFHSCHFTDTLPCFFLVSLVSEQSLYFICPSILCLKLLFYTFNRDTSIKNIFAHGLCHDIVLNMDKLLFL